MFDWIAFDADDTLWKNEEYYLQGRDLFFRILEKYDLGVFDPELVNAQEVSNIQYYGYGVMSFVLSLIELGIQLTQGRIHSSDINKLLDLGKDMLSVETELYSGVQPLLESLSQKYKLMLITKGDLHHQQRKFTESGLTGYFQALEVVSEKTPAVYQKILDFYQIAPEKFLMIGNSLRSDIMPVLNLGARAIHLTEHLTWSHEENLIKDLPGERLIEVDGIEQVLKAVEQFNRQAR